MAGSMGGKASKGRGRPKLNKTKGATSRGQKITGAIRKTGKRSGTRDF